MNEKTTEILSSVGRYYAEKLKIHGPVARGVDWNSRESQELRFDQLLKIVDFAKPFSVNDLGCGVGYLYDYLKKSSADFKYSGADISSAMILQARASHAGISQVQFVNQLEDLPRSDFTVASGIFNVCLQHEMGTWEKYISDILESMNRISARGFAFNMLTKYSDPGKLRPDLYYADPCRYFDLCKTRFSKKVALNHDYDLFEFTLLVRK